MNSWLAYLAFLSEQNHTLTLEDFTKVRQNQKKIRHAEELAGYVSHPETQNHLRKQKYWWRTVEQTALKCQSLNIKTTWPFHPDYPSALLRMEVPPLFISWKGENCWSNLFLLSVVGSRQAYQDTLLWMDTHLSPFLKRKKGHICLMSGGARGVDQKAHAVCMASQNPTLCFLPCGITNHYPQALEQWEQPILDGGGALISVFPITAQMRKCHFHIRNRVLACLSHLLLIAQAQIRSGTMVTARYALHAGTTIAALPGSPLYGGYGGNLSLINDGCFMIRDHLDLETLYHSCKLKTIRSSP